jgi:hypothetical protein
VLGLLCIRQAKEGGESAFCSALAVYNEMLRRGRLDLVAVLAGAGQHTQLTAPNTIAIRRARARHASPMLERALRMTAHAHTHARRYARPT